MTDYGPDQVGRLYAEKHAEALHELGRFNLAVFGKTGAGKSTLVNAIFGQRVAATGTGRPVTTGLQYYAHPEGILGLYDSAGFETGEAGDVVLDRLDEIVRESRSKPIAERIHAAWYTVRWSDRRFESRQGDFVRRLSDLGLPVVMVLTQVPMNAAGRLHPDAVELAAYIEGLGLPLRPTTRAYLTNALEDPFHATPVHGLQALLDATFETAPEAALLALTAAQQIDLERKRQAATRIVRTSAGAAVATGATPIPFSDAAILIPLQVTMLARVTATFGLEMPNSQLAGLVGSLTVATGATTAGRWLVSSLLRVVPGGQLPAMAISGSVAGALTSAMGMAWIAVCERLLESGTTSLQADALREVFREEFLSRLRRRPEISDGASARE